MDEYVLYHHGIKGMRWGIRRYQNPDGSLTAAGQRRAEKEAKKQEKEAKKREEHEKAKEAAVKTGSAKDVLKFKNELTKQEMNDAMSRIRWEQEMARASIQSVSKGKLAADRFFNGLKDANQKANTVLDVTDTVVRGTNTLIKGYNTFANIFNSIPGSPGDTYLPRIDTQITSGNREQRRQWKKQDKEDIQEMLLERSEANYNGKYVKDNKKNNKKSGKK